MMRSRSRLHRRRNAMTATRRPCGRPKGHISNPARPNAPISSSRNKARLVELRGQVLTCVCRPLPRALIDLWHADERGEYDAAVSAIVDIYSRMLRDAIASAPFCRRSTLAAPATTTSRCRRRSRRVLTTQLYFPDEPMNRRDSLFRRELLMRMWKRAMTSPRGSISCSTCARALMEPPNAHALLDAKTAR